MTVLSKNQRTSDILAVEALTNITTDNQQPTLIAAQQSYRDAMCHLAAAVNIVTTDGDAGKSGFTASAVCSVTDTPPTLLVCVNRGASVYSTFKQNRVLCVNTLARHHKELSATFGGKTPMQARFAKGSWSILSTGSPVLEDAIIAFDCVVKEITSVGTHDIFVCEVQEIKHNPMTNSLIYFNRDYHQLTKCAI